MEKLSFSAALLKLKEAGVIQGAKSILDIPVDIKDVKPLLKTATKAKLGSVDGYAVNVDGITIKFTSEVRDAIAMADSHCTISLFEASIKDKDGKEQTIKYARFTAAE